MSMLKPSLYTVFSTFFTYLRPPESAKCVMKLFTLSLMLYNRNILVPAGPKLDFLKFQ